MSKVIVPIVHMNGTSKQELLDLREQLFFKLNETFQALKQMAPNQRDYYVAANSAELWALALVQHHRRMKALSDMMSELEEECTLIQEQGKD